jgi:hypothetical protein
MELRCCSAPQLSRSNSVRDMKSANFKAAPNHLTARVARHFNHAYTHANTLLHATFASRSPSTYSATRRPSC